jgi:succinate dehydrogenase/fumarate reductase flavoprotein subunit
MAGLSAGGEAARLGASVGVVEKLENVGGSAAISAGDFWAPRHYEELRARIPGGEPALGRALTDDFFAVAEWIRDARIEMSEQIEFEFGVGWQIDVRGWLSHCIRLIETANGWVARQTTARALLRDSAGSVAGARLTSNGDEIVVDAGAVVLATGGFQGDPALVASFIGPHADRILVRSNPGSVGDGFRMASEVGGAASRSLGGFYGHLVGSPVDDWSERHFLPLTQYHSAYCVAVDMNGLRFADESRGDEYTNQAVASLPGRRAVLIADEDTRQSRVISAPYPRADALDRFRAAADAGARYASGASFGELADAIAAWGVPRSNLLATLDGYAQASRGEAVQASAPLPRVPQTLATPPFHALEVQPTITFPLGGIRIDADARVLDHDDRPIRGLFASGADAGGLYHEGYGGGLAMSCVFGRRAARAAISILGRHPVA